MMQELLSRVERLWRRTDDIPAFQWAEVRSISPLKIRFDGVANDSAGSPSSTVHGLKTGDRVLCLVRRNRVTVIGSASTNTFATKSALNAWSPADGAMAYVTSDRRHYERSNGSWVPLAPRMLRGSVDFPPITVNEGINLPVTFPAGYFKTPPVVMVQPSNARLTPRVGEITTSGFDYGVYNWTNANAGVANGCTWVAFEE